MDSLRIDKWLWAARFYKTRSLATDEVSKHRVQVNGQDVKPSRDIKVGDVIRLRQAQVERTVLVKALSAVRGPAPVAQLLYEETEASMLARAKAAEQRHFAMEPALSIEQGRPTKRNRRQMQRGWDDRWSAGVD